MFGFTVGRVKSYRVSKESADVALTIKAQHTPCQIEGLDVNQSGLYIMDRGRNTT
jgi:hypothetical protein